MKPCDCESVYDIEKHLYVNGISFNENSIEITGGPVILTIGPCTIRISKKHFKAFAEWYLEDQKAEDYYPLIKDLKLKKLQSEKKIKNRSIKSILFNPLNKIGG